MTRLKTFFCLHHRSKYLYLLTTSILFLTSWSAQALTFTVTNTNDSGTGSLRQAVNDSNAAMGADTIIFDPVLSGSTIILTSGEINVTGFLTISGPIVGDASSITIDGNNNSRLFFLDGRNFNLPDLTLNNITLTRGYATGRGGAVLAIRSNLSLNDCLVSNNVVEDSPSFLVSFGDGGGLVATNITMNRSTVSGNSASNAGGISGTTVTLNDSTVSGNSANSGGGISANSITLNQSTVSGNSADSGRGGGIDALLRGDVTLIQSTITNNHGGGLVFTPTPNETRTLTLINTILAGNTGSGGNLSFSNTIPTFSLTVNARNSLFGDDPSEINGLNTSNVFSNSPDLGVLQFNGGPTQTHLPNSSSPALDTGSNADIPESIDQRGLPRIFNGIVDIGTTERQPLPINPIPIFSLPGLLTLIASFTALAGWRQGKRYTTKTKSISPC